MTNSYDPWLHIAYDDLYRVHVGEKFFCNVGEKVFCEIFLKCKDRWVRWNFVYMVPPFYNNFICIQNGDGHLIHWQKFVEKTSNNNLLYVWIVCSISMCHISKERLQQLPILHAHPYFACRFGQLLVFLVNSIIYCRWDALSPIWGILKEMKSLISGVD